MICLLSTWLHHLLEWSGDRTFDQISTIRPTFPQYMLSARRDGNDGQLSQIYLEKVIQSARRFLEWHADHDNALGLPKTYLDTLVMPRMPDEVKEREFVTIEEVRTIARTEVHSLIEERARAGAVFLFLSGMRVTAFATLPLKAVDINRRLVRQWPSLGVKTKNGKLGTTYLLDIPDLLGVVRDWDSYVRKQVPPHGLWYAELQPLTGEIVASPGAAGARRGSLMRKHLRKWMRGAGLPYHSPHKFRHGHAVYVLTEAQDVADLKAISMNLMHSSLTVTDSIYAVLSDSQVEDRIGNLGKGERKSDAKLASLVRELLSRIDKD